MKPSQDLVEKLKRLWMRFMLRGVRYSDNFRKIDTIYLVEDPWSMSSPAEQYRFAETNRLVAERFGQVGSLLEIGCGEGHQSLHLVQVCDHVIGLDISARAVERARSRCPQGEFLVGDIFSKELDARGPFDLVVASEVLYYITDTRAVLQRMRALGRNNLVTYFTGSMATLDPQVLSLPGVVSEIMEFERSRWRAAWWRGDVA
jgi:SAM-dependent methyltransferase